MQATGVQGYAGFQHPQYHHLNAVVYDDTILIFPTHSISGVLVQGHLLATHLISRTPMQAVGVELVDMQHMNGTFDAEMMQLAGDF